MSTNPNAPLLTFVTPVGTYHEALAERAIASVRAQSVSCQHIVVYDRQRRGAGWARNRGLEQVSTPFVSFIDSDDWLEPDFAEKCLLAYDGRRYVYTDWWGWLYNTTTREYVTERKDAPCSAWKNEQAHIITTLLPTDFVRRVGGFDESLPFCEDTDFYVKLQRNGLCGKLLPQPLFHYGKEGQRAQQAYIAGHEPETGDRQYNAAFHEIMRLINERYKGLPMAEDCNGCGGYPNANTPGASSGDVMATTLWHGTRTERGRATGRHYRGGWGEVIPVDPRDIDAAPSLFSRVLELPPRVSEDDLQAFRKFSADMRVGLGGSLKDTTQEPVPAYVAQGEVKPDVAQVIRLYQQNT